MLTKAGHTLAAYVLVTLGMCHWLRGRHLAADELAAAAPVTTATEPAD